MTTLSIILPTYNEKDNVIILVNRIIKLLNNFPSKEIIIVDDSSSDKTYSLVKNKFKNKKFIKIFLRKKEFSLAFKNANSVVLCPVYAAGEKLKLGFNYLNFAKAIATFEQSQVALQAAQQTFVQIKGLTLFNYI